MVDIGGGSTEFVVGHGHDMEFHVSTQAGVVRHSERHLHTDPPAAEELEALARDVRAIYADGVPEDVRARVREGIAVAGTATQLASVDGAATVDGHVLTAERIRELRDMLAALPLSERRDVPGLDPERAPTIVAGAVLLGEALDLFGLDRVEVSERDILHGAALNSAR
jgi:exopolyphosphatase/guanosine-5'-triphosphate,3'-diphosphate pyrophosphatase